ncbi:hypothetical protein C1646_753597 [Rhizophagus diaphanus]|nr:hypothetical protein C1646_753597 [Rhizophagus diaphanus] [Rhizophagus sp. MUCL 43196]
MIMLVLACNKSKTTRPSSSSNIVQQLIRRYQLTRCVSNFFYKPLNDYQIYDISYRKTPISFELVSEILDNNNNNYSVQNHAQPNNLHEFYFLKVEEKKCYKVTCVLIPYLSIVEYLNKNIHGVEFNHDEQQQEI